MPKSKAQIEKDKKAAAKAAKAAQAAAAVPPPPPPPPPADGGFPPELARSEEPNMPRVPLPPVDPADPNGDRNFNKDGTPISDEGRGAQRDAKAAAAVASGAYTPGVRPPFNPGEQKLFCAPDDVFFVGPKSEDVMTDPRNGRPIRPARGGTGQSRVDSMGRPLETPAPKE